MKKQKHLEIMEEVINTIQQACELARNLELDLPNLANNNPAMLSLAIEEITKTLSGAKERLSLVSQNETKRAQNMDATDLMQEWLRSSHALTMDHQLFQMQQLHAARSTLQIGEMRGRDVEDSHRFLGSQGEVQAIQPSPARPRRRSSRELGDIEKRKELVPAPEFGNTEMPPEDGYTWRKYGQKDILGSKHPRSYYRCTHKKLYECQAKRQVQRVDENPNIFEVTYRGKHTCHMSSTAPSPSVPPHQQLTHINNSNDNINFSLQGGGGGSGDGGASTSRYGSGSDYPVVDMADVMFNSASSSGNSMESLFHSALAEDNNN